MSNAVFPTLKGIAWDKTWVPQFSTKIQKSVSGKEYRSSMMASPLYKVSLTYEFLRAGDQGDLQNLVGFFLARRGSYDSFLVKLPVDNSVTNQLLAVGDGVTNQFHFVRSFGSEFAEYVANPLTVTAVTVGAVPLAAGQFQQSSGLLTLGAAPASGAQVRASFSYYYRARFAADETEYSEFMHNLWTAKKIDLLACLGTKI